MFQILVEALSRCFVILSTNTHMIHDFHDFGLRVAKRCHILFVTINIVFLPTRHFEQDTPDRAPVTMKLNTLNACPLASRSILRRRNVRYKLCAVFTAKCYVYNCFSFCNHRAKENISIIKHLYLSQLILDVYVNLFYLVRENI